MPSHIQLVCGVAFYGSLLLSPLLFAATYYADFTSGNDANDGLTTGSPWKRMPGMPNETVTPGFSNGDIICLKGGETWPDQISVVAGVSYYSVGGSATAAAVCAGWGSGKAVIDVPLVTGAYGAIQLSSGDVDVTIDGVQAINRATNSAFVKAGIYAEGSSGQEITGLIVRNSSATLSANGLAIIGDVNDFLIEDSDFSDNIGNISESVCTGSGIVLGNNDGSTTTFNGIVRSVTALRNGPTCFDVPAGYNEGRGITLSGPGSTLTIEDSTFMDNGGSPDGPGVEAGGWDNVIFRRNLVSGYTAAEIKAGADNWTGYGNVFIGSSSSGHVFQYGYFGSDSVGSIWTHNTIVSTGALVQPIVELSSPGTTSVFRNNLILCPAGNTVSAIVFNTAGTSWSQSTWDNHIDHNDVQGCTTYANEYDGANTHRTLSAHQSAYPSQAQASTHDDDLGILSDYRPGAGSVVRRAGGSQVLCQDARGRACYPDRPDIGAYQSTSGDPAATRAVRN